MVAGETVRTGAIADAGVDDYEIADLDVGDLASHRLHLAARVGPDDPRRYERHPRQPGQREEIDVVQCCRADAHSNVGRRLQRRHGKIVAQLQLLEAAVRRDRECSHEVECIFWALSSGLWALKGPKAHGSKPKALMTSIK